ncbi:MULTISPECIES: class I SAM-dependent methyltransferase [Burkholderia]|uniref:Class I SAM-dependent methyltransferase n=2 Tax=Burkholderiaceae TaxID=119060 RepID=A0ABV2CA37_9BURK|nr:class I SAM-dependent methyltransferase [Burkholderia sp. CpTa8-5]MBP0607664.1 class I SAM-dependent methyltransferase [Burkholderia sp. CpTa8-5]
MDLLDTDLDAYLRAVGMSDGIGAHHVACEICGGDACDVVVDEVETVDGRYHRLPVVVCRRCGFLYQNPRFDRSFYQRYYEQHYRNALFGNVGPARDFVLDQMRRGEHLFRNLEAHLPPGGRMLDVGCSAGGMMIPFAKRGWRVAGNDPDAAYSAFGRERLRLDIETVAAEDMRLPDAQFDLIVIIGSLEHVYDVNSVLAACRKACVPGGLLLIEGRALGYGVIKGHFSHNHRRYLTIASIEMLMLRHGWVPVLSTDEPICGPTRPGAVHVLGRASAPIDGDSLLSLLDERWPERHAPIAQMTSLKGYIRQGAADSLLSVSAR